MKRFNTQNLENKIVLTSFTLCLIVASIAVYFYFSSQGFSLEFSGIRIYDAIYTINLLTTKGINFTVEVLGKDLEGNVVDLKGRVVGCGKGYFFLETKSKRIRIVEGPLGYKDVRASWIKIVPQYRFSVEALFRPRAGKKFTIIFSHCFYEGSVALDGASITPSKLLLLESIFPELKGEERIEIKQLNTGIILRFLYPVPCEIAEKLVNSFNYTHFSTDYERYFLPAESMDEVKNLEKMLINRGAVLVNYHKAY